MLKTGLVKVGEVKLRLSAGECERCVRAMLDNFERSVFFVIVGQKIEVYCRPCQLNPRRLSLVKIFVRAWSYAARQNSGKLAA